MPYIPDEIIDQVRERADIVDVIGSFVQLKKRGGDDYWACCPFHKEKTPSFKINAQRQAFYCFGCKKSGNVFHFIQEHENVDFVGAVHWLAQRFGVHIPEPEPGSGGPPDAEAAARRRKEREAGYALLERTARWYNQQLGTPESRLANEYLQSRGIDGETVARFGLGYAPDSWDATLAWAQRQGFDRDLVVTTGLAIQREEQPERCYDRFRGRLMFPIRDELGRVVGFSGRVLEADAKSAKYVNTPETAFFQKSRILYGLHLARQAFKDMGCALVCEGQLDVIACHRAGLTHAVSAQGTAFTEHHGRLLARSTETVTLAFDADEAGEKAAVRTIDILHRAGLAVRIVPLPEGEDPDSIFRKQGPEALREMMAGGEDAVPYVFSLARGRCDMATAQGKSAAAHDVLATVKEVPDPVARAAHCQWLSQQLSLPEQAIHELLRSMMQERRPRRPSAQGPPEEAPAAPRMPAFTMRSREDDVLCVLLDLALSIESAARAMLPPKLPHEMIPDTPLGQALNLVLACTEQGEWHEAADEISGSNDLVANEDVGRILAAPSCQHLDPAQAEDRYKDDAGKRLMQAVDDCVARLKLLELDRSIEEAHRKLAETRDREEARELQKQCLELQNRKRLLQNRNE